MSHLGSRQWASLVLLAFAAFTYNTSESFPVGLLPQMSSDLGVSEAAVGRLLTVYAIVVAITVLPLVSALSAVARRRVVLLTIGTLVISNIAMAVAPTYPWVLGSRLVSATTHGIFWSIVAPTAAMLVPKGRVGFATAAVFMGSSLAMVAGTPLTTALGVLWGWRIAILILAIAAGVSFVGLLLVLPKLEVNRTHSGDGRLGWMRVAVSTMRNRQLLLICILTCILVLAYFATYTYIALILDRFAGVRDEGLAVVLLVYGIAGLVGVWIIGKFSDQYPRGSALLCMVSLAVAFAGIMTFAKWSPVGVIVSVVVLGAAFAATPVFLQAAVLRVSPEAGDVASSLYVVSFQVGIAGGSLAGGFAVDAGWLGATPWVAAGAVFAGIFLYWSFSSRAIGQT